MKIDTFLTPFCIGSEEFFIMGEMSDRALGRSLGYKEDIEICREIYKWEPKVKILELTKKFLKYIRGQVYPITSLLI